MIISSECWGHEKYYLFINIIKNAQELLNYEINYRFFILKVFQQIQLKSIFLLFFHLVFSRSQTQRQK